LRRHLTPDSAAITPPTSTRNLRWFDLPVALSEKLSLTVSPSLATPIAATVTETVKIGTRITVDPAMDFALLGEAVHACLAVYLATKDVSMSEDDIDAVLRRNGIEGVVAAAAVLRQLGAVRAWLAARWPDAEPLVEIPIAQVLDNGQIINGRVDLLLKTNVGWILIDHKSGAQNSTQWDKLAAGYGGQLAMYGAAIKAATGVSVVENWLVLPVAGVALRVTPTAEFGTSKYTLPMVT
jgi:ATP-dependent exoDNAse (exonuclease V) beta subunit